MRFITLAEYLQGRDSAYPSDYTEQIAQNAKHTVEVINEFLQATGFDGHVSSGWRPPALNAATAGAAPHSKHMLALACDLHDKDGLIDSYIDTSPAILDRFNLWREHPDKTPKWTHLQCVPYGSWVSGKSRTFIP